MEANEANRLPPYQWERQPLLVDVMPEFGGGAAAVRDPKADHLYRAAPDPVALKVRDIWLPAVLFVATCASTFVAAGYLDVGSLRVGLGRPPSSDGLMYSFAVMTILLCHEMGHFFRPVRYGVRATLPYFIPMPLTPIGTFGAVIAHGSAAGQSPRAVFDIGISGPLAGLVPTLLFLSCGPFLEPLRTAPTRQAWSSWRAAAGEDDLTRGCTGRFPRPIHSYHPLAFAGWVGLLITSINLMPIGQLDGGHILLRHVPQVGTCRVGAGFGQRRFSFRSGCGSIPGGRCSG